MLRKIDSLRSAPLLVLIGLLLHAPILGMGFYADDYVMQLFQTGGIRAPVHDWNLYDFGTYDHWISSPIGTGGFPWWTSTEWAVRFFRPLSTMVLWLDRALFGDWALGHQLMGFLTFGLLLALLPTVLRGIGLSRRESLVALLIFALSNDGVIAIGWSANRNALLALLFTAIALGFAARPPTVASVAAALTASLLALLSKESGLAALAVVLVALWQERGDASSRRLATAGAVTAGVIAVAYVAALAVAGYGSHSVFYATPWREPLVFTRKAIELFLVGGTSLLSPFPSDVVAFFPATRLPVLAFCALVVAPVAIWVARTVRGHRSTSLLAVWLVAGLLPQAGAPISDRLLFEASVASSALLAVFFVSFKERLSGDAGTRPVASLAAHSLFLVVTVGSGLALVVTSFTVRDMANDLRALALATEVGEPTGELNEVIVLQAESSMAAFTLTSTWAFETGRDDVRFSLAQAGGRGLLWERTGEATCEVESVDDPFLTALFEIVYLTESTPPAPGTTWECPTFTVEAVRSDDVGLRRFRLVFPEPLDSPRYQFVVAGPNGLVRIEPPAVGETIEVPSATPSNPMVP